MKTKITLIALAMIIVSTMSYSQSSLKVISNGNVGVNTDNPIEKLQVNGGINLGNTNINAPGSIRWTGEDFEGFDGLDWKSLTNCGCDAEEEGSSTNSQDDQNQEEEEEQEEEQNQEEEEEQDESSSDDQTSDAGCETTNDIITASIELDQDWTNQINTNGMGFSDKGQICYTIPAYEGNTTQMLGLSDDPSIDGQYENINYAFYHRIVSTLNSHRVYIWENNERKGIFLNTRESYAGSTFCIKRNENAEIEYFINDELVYTSETKSNADLYFDNSFYGYSDGSSSIWTHQPSNIEVSDISVCSNSESDLISNQSKQTALLETTLGILDQNYPNPFIDESTIGYDLSAEIYDEAEMIITNNLGQIVDRKNLKNQSGLVKIKAKNLTSGVYHYSIYLDGEAMEAKQMVVN